MLISLERGANDGSADATATPSSHPDWFNLSDAGLPAYPGCRGKEAVKRAFSNCS